MQLIYRKAFPYPKTLQIHITSKCNLNCSYCYSDTTSSDDLDVSQILIEAAKLGVKHIDFLGGEPLTCTRLKEYIQFCDQNKMSILIHTNGLLFNQDWINILSQLKYSPVIHLKFDHKDALESVIGKNNFDPLMATIRKMIERGIAVHANIIVTKENTPIIDKVIQSAEEVGMMPIFERYMTIGRPEIDSNFAITEEEWNQSLSRLNSIHRKKNPHFQLSAALKGNTCSCYIDLLSIDVKGNVKPCPFAIDEQIIGNVIQESLKTIWKKFRFYRNEWLKIPDECQKCDLKLLCHGGCKTNTFKEKRSYNAKDPLCNRKQLPTGVYNQRHLK